MRSVRNFIVLFVLGLSLGFILPLYAADTYFDIPSCSSDTTAPCETTGDGVNTNIPLSRTMTFISEVAANVWGPKNIVLDLIGSLTPDSTYQIGTKKLTTYKDQVQVASDVELNLAEMQDREQHDIASKDASMTSRLCVYDPITNNLIGESVSTTTIKSDKIAYAYPEPHQRLSSFTTNYVQETQDYRRPNITILASAALECGKQWTGGEIHQNARTYTDQNTYGTTIWDYILHIPESIVQTIPDPRGSPYPPTYRSDVTFPAYVEGTEQHPWSGQIEALSAGCATSDALQEVSYSTDTQKQMLCNSGGYINSMYRPDFIDNTYKTEQNAVEPAPNQGWNFFISFFGGGSRNAENSHAHTKRIGKAGDYMNCTLNQADYDNPGLKEGECNENWVGSSSSTPMSCDAVFSGITYDPSKYAGFSPSGGLLGFNIDVHNTSCTVPNIEAVADFAQGWGAGNPALAHDNVVQYYSTLEQYAQAYGWSPAYLLAQWIEETVAGSMGNLRAQMGCKYSTSTVNPVSLCEQIRCIYNIPSQMDLWALLCVFGGDIDSVPNNHCTTFYIDSANDNRCYPENFFFVYKRVFFDGGVSPACAATGNVSATMQQDCDVSGRPHIHWAGS